MSTTIGGIQLDRDMYFENEYEYSRVNATVTPTIAGGLLIQEFSKSEKGREITLSSYEGQGLQTKATVDSLHTLKNVADATYTLTISSNSQTFTKTVRFRNELAGGPVQFEPVMPRQGIHSSTVYFKGKIYLMVV